MTIINGPILNKLLFPLDGRKFSLKMSFVPSGKGQVGNFSYISPLEPMYHTRPPK